MMSIL